jgi:tetratricopeptide (TPR) repeat protein
MHVEFDEIEKLAKKGRYKEAFEQLALLKARNPDEPKIWACQAFVIGRRGDLRAAIASWTRAIELCPEEPHYFYMRGIDFFNIKEYRNAVADFTKVIRLCAVYKSDYYREPAYFFRADAHIRLREFDKAKEDLSNVSEDARTWTDRLRSRAELLAECN